MLRIDRIMKERGLSTNSLAEKMNVSPQYVSKVANGRKNITLASLQKFAIALGVPLASLIEGNHDAGPHGVPSIPCPYCGCAITITKA